MHLEEQHEETPATTTGITNVSTKTSTSIRNMEQATATEASRSVSSKDAADDPTSSPLQSLELEDTSSSPSNNESIFHNRKATSPEYAKLRYIGLATLAMVLALTCPGTTFYKDQPWTKKSIVSSRNVQWKILFQGMGLYLSTLIFLLLLNGSDPGRLKDLGELLEDVEQETLLLTAEKNSENGDAHMMATTNNSSVALNHRQSSSRDDTLVDYHSPAHSAANNANEEKNDRDAPSSTISHPTALFHGTRRRYCPTCRLSPPLRSHHCKQCNCCIATFDHHCDFVGTCIGERNHARFWWFLLCQAISFSFLCHVVGSSRWGLTTFLFPPTSAEDAVSFLTVLRVVVAKCYLYPLQWVAWIMVFLHTFMALSNSTTFEVSKGPRHLEYLKGTKLSDLPFGQVRLRNLALLFLQDRLQTHAQRCFCFALVTNNYRD